MVARKPNATDKWNYNAVRKMAIDCGVDDIAINIATHFELHVLYMLPEHEREAACKAFEESCPSVPYWTGPAPDPIL